MAHSCSGSEDDDLAALLTRFPKTAVKLAIHYLKKNAAVSAGAGPTSKGTIICTASNAGLYPFPVAPLYAASKFGVIGLVRALARPLEKESIQINALAPAVLGMLFPDVIVWAATKTPSCRNQHRAEQGFIQAHDNHPNVDTHTWSPAAGV